ncbi:hypothetical protein, partial [Dialister hominis]|uniref:hypothetical protein n=1 Tax=Dialister hominis TaxID=2582419 RepID=UPI00307A3920
PDFRDSPFLSHFLTNRDFSMSIFGAQVGNFIKKIDFDIVSFPKWNVFKNKSGKFKLFHSERTCPHPVESP